MTISPVSFPVSSDAHLEHLHGILRFIRPKPCPVPLIRIGGETDGAYLVPDDLDGIEACFSPGVANRKSFEDSLLQTQDIRSHMCDFSSDADAFQTPLVEGKQTFLKKWLATDNNPESISFADWINLFEPGPQDLLMQMDIEGAEYQNITGLDRDILTRFRVIVIELHSLNSLNSKEFTSDILKPFFDKLEANFICVHAHPNNASRQVEVVGTDFRVPPILELTLLRKDRANGKQDALIPPQIPHPLDILRNIRTRDPQFLDSNWRDGPQSDASRVMQLKDEVDYLRIRANSPEAVRQFSWMLKSCAASPRTLARAPKGKLVDCAKGKPFYLSSKFGTMPLKGVVEQKSPFFFHTANEIGPRITIDLEQDFVLREIAILNRTNGWFSRCECLIAVLHSEPDPETGTGFPFALSDEFLQGKTRKTTLSLPDLEVRYVSLATPLQTALHLSNIKIMGLPAKDRFKGRILRRWRLS